MNETPVTPTIYKIYLKINYLHKNRQVFQIEIDKSVQLI